MNLFYASRRILSDLIIFAFLKVAKEALKWISCRKIKLHVSRPLIIDFTNQKRARPLEKSFITDGLPTGLSDFIMNIKFLWTFCAGTKPRQTSPRCECVATKSLRRKQLRWSEMISGGKREKYLKFFARVSRAFEPRLRKSLIQLKT